MGTSINGRPMVFGDGVTNAAQDLRLGNSGQMTALGTAGSTGLASRGGVCLRTGTPLAVTAGSGMSVTVAVGQCYVPAASGDSGGLYLLTLDTGGSLTVSAADPTNPRIDLVCALITDVGSGSSTAVVEIITGTPAASPSLPALPAGGLALAQVLVPAGSSSVSSGNISDLRAWTAALGGILPVANSSAYPTTGDAAGAAYAHDMSTGRLKRWNGSRLTAPLVAPWAAVTASGDATASSTTPQTCCSVTVTVDGSTSVKVTADAGGFAVPSGGVGNAFTVSVARDGTVIKSWQKTITQTSNRQLDGGSFTVSDPTPAAGSHTYSVRVQNQGAGTITSSGMTILAEPQAL